MNPLGAALTKELEDQFESVFSESVTDSARQHVSEALFAWLSFIARKKASANLPQQIEEMRKRFVVLANSFELHYVRGKLVVKASGEAENTLRMLERGTDWFDPAPDVTGLIAGAVLD